MSQTALRSGAAPSAPAKPRRSLQDMSTRSGVILFLVELVVVLALWQYLIGTLELVNPLFLPPPLETSQALGDLLTSGELWPHAIAFMKGWFAGFGLAAILGVLGGLLIGSSIAADRLTAPILWTIYATPWLAYRPLSKAWFGFGLTPVIFLVFIAAVFPTLFNVSAGIRTTKRSLLNAGRIFGASRSVRYRRIVLPWTVPYIITGLRQSAVIATIALIVAEMTGPSVGMGALIIFKANTFNTAESFAAIALIVLWSVAMSQLIKIIGRIVAPWSVQ